MTRLWPFQRQIFHAEWQAWWKGVHVSQTEIDCVAETALKVANDQELAIRKKQRILSEWLGRTADALHETAVQIAANLRAGTYRKNPPTLPAVAVPSAKAGTMENHDPSITPKLTPLASQTQAEAKAEWNFSHGFGLDLVKSGIILFGLVFVDICINFAFYRATTLNDSGHLTWDALLAIAPKFLVLVFLGLFLGNCAKALQERNPRVFAFLQSGFAILAVVFLIGYSVASGIATNRELVKEFFPFEKVSDFQIETARQNVSTAKTPADKKMAERELLELTAEQKAIEVSETKFYAEHFTRETFARGISALNFLAFLSAMATGFAYFWFYKDYRTYRHRRELRRFIRDVDRFAKKREELVEIGEALAMHPVRTVQEIRSLQSEVVRACEIGLKKFDRKEFGLASFVAKSQSSSPATPPPSHNGQKVPQFFSANARPYFRREENGDVIIAAGEVSSGDRNAISPTSETSPPDPRAARLRAARESIARLRLYGDEKVSIAPPTLPVIPIARNNNGNPKEEVSHAK